VKRLEDRMAAAEAAARDPDAPGALAALEAALRAKSGVLVAIAARVIASRDLGLVDELAPAFARLCERPLERDPGCRGKVAIARALHDADRWVEEVFAPGVRLVQEEPVWGGRIDTAAELRGVCALAYAHFGRPEALDVAAELLADRERTARVAAAQALGDSGHPDATAVLRFKALTGDPEPEVLGACFASLLALAPEASLGFVARFLDDRERDEAAALALGESRLEAAFPLLVRWADGSPRVGFLALALLRQERATAHLIDRIRDGTPKEALAAIAALGTFRADAGLAARVREASAAQRDQAVRAALEETFGD